jgi:hypothetical protein
MLLAQVSAVDGPRLVKFKQGGGENVTNVLLLCGENVEDLVQMSAWNDSADILGQLIEGRVCILFLFFTYL